VVASAPAVAGLATPDAGRSADPGMPGPPGRAPGPANLLSCAAVRDLGLSSSTLATLLRLAWPVVVARSSQAVIGFADALMTSSLGEAELAAVTTGALNTFTIAILPMGIVFIVQSFAAQLSAKGDLAAARRYAWYGLLLSAVIAVVAAACIPVVAPLLGLLSYEPEVHAHMSDYLAIRLLALGAVVATEGLGNWFGGLGNTRLHMVSGVVAMVVNVALNWVLIYGMLGMPALGVEGAALASVIASWTGLAVLAVAFGRGWVAPRAPGGLGLRWSEFVRMLRFGVPSGLNWFLEFAAFMVFINVVIADLGTVTLAALMVVFNINSVSFMPAFGIASAGAILSGQAIGRGEYDHVPALVKTTIAVTGVWQVSVGLIYLAIPYTLMGWFAPAGQPAGEMVQVGSLLLVLSAAWQLFDAVAISLSEALRSAGDTAWTMWARLAIAWLLFTPAALVSVRVLHGGPVAAMLCLIGYLFVLALVLVWRFRRGVWRTLDLTGLGEGPA
jgi:multidrug resistance protein, MATE family